jgi:hypothetical protein
MSRLEYIIAVISGIKEWRISRKHLCRPAGISCCTEVSHKKLTGACDVEFHSGNPIINFQLTLLTSSGFCKNVSLAVLFGSNVNSYAIPTHVDMCIYTHILHNIETLVAQKKD